MEPVFKLWRLAQHPAEGSMGENREPRVRPCFHAHARPTAEGKPQKIRSELKTRNLPPAVACHPVELGMPLSALAYRINSGPLIFSTFTLL